MSNTVTVPFGTYAETEKHACAQADVQDLAEKVLKFPELAHLRDQRIRYIYFKKEKKKGGKILLGTASKFSDRDRMLHNWDFLITLNAEFWEKNPTKREPLLFHELLHCDVDADGNRKMRPHDVEEFGDVVARYGLWKNDLEDYQEQFELFGTEEVTATAANA